MDKELQNKAIEELQARIKDFTLEELQDSYEYHSLVAKILSAELTKRSSFDIDD